METGIFQIQPNCHLVVLSLSLVVHRELTFVTSKVDLYIPHGIYRCDIQTTAAHDDTDTSVRETLFVGLYTDSGKLFVDF